VEQARLLKESAQNLTVLYVEDDDDLRDETVEFLKKFFHTVDVARNGKDGLDSFAKHRQDLVITDIIMPVMEGLEMIELIRQIDTEVPILIISACDYGELVKPSLPNGADVFLKKPVSYDNLISTISAMIENISTVQDDAIHELKKRVKDLEARVKALEEEKRTSL